MARAIVMSEPDNLSEDEIQLLAEKAGAVPSRHLAFAPRSSISLLEPSGSRQYRRKLSNAAYDLHRSLREATILHAAHGHPVIVRGREIGKVPDVTKAMSKEADGPALEALLHSLAHVASSPKLPTGRRQGCVAVPFDRAAYQSGQDHDHLNASSVRKYVLALVHIGWLDFVWHYYDRATGHGMRNRVASTRTLEDWMVERGLVFPLHPNGPKPGKRLEDDQLLWVSYGERDSDGKKPRRQLDRQLDKSEEILPALNDALAKQKVSCPLSSYDQYVRIYDFNAGKPRIYLGGGTAIYRVFNEQDGWGGRLYGHWVQGLPKDLRKQLQINRRPAAELDYSGMQLALLYAIQGRSIPVGDPYAISGFSRDDMKAVLTRSVGTSTREEALSSIRKRLYDESRSKSGLAEQMYDAFWAAHPGVCPHGYFNAAAWTRLQMLDSQLALGVIRSLLDQGITPIPIHDSFVVEAQYAGATRHVMEQEFGRMFPGASIRVEYAW